jgi:AcrR family transcriptional regulator
LLAEYETLMVSWQRRRLAKFLRNSQLIVDLLHRDPTLSINSRQLTKQYDRDKVTRPSYLRLKRQAHQIRSAASAYAGTLATVGRIDWVLTSELSRVKFAFIQSVQYSPPSGFDDVVFRKIAAGDELEMLRAIVLIAAADETRGTIQTVTELVQRMFDALQIERGAPQFAIVFTAVIRIVFDRAYLTAPSLLSAFTDKSALFAAACERAERMTVATLGLTQGLLPGGNDRKQIGTVFRHNRMPSLAVISFCTNPIDLVYQIYLVVDTFNLKMAPGSALAHNDVVALLYAAIVSAPPPSALGIAKFLVVWEKLVSGESLTAARRAFLEAMQRIYPIDEL